MKKTLFGTMPDGQVVEEILLESETARCSLITYGAALRSMEVPDKNGILTDVVLGFDSLEAYRAQDMFMGAVIGRYANRIGGSSFTLGGKEYKLYPNENPNHLHGGKKGFDKRIWDYGEIDCGVRFRLTSPHMDEGYPGNMELQVDYILTGSDLSIHYSAKCDSDTVCNLTNHAYFNLEGHASGPVLGHTLKLFADKYTPVSGSASIPTGEIADVSGTPMDFTTPREIGADIDCGFEQIRFTAGYDHNWTVNGEQGVLRPAAMAYGPKTGVRLEAETTLPGIQFYSGNYMSGKVPGKGGIAYEKRGGFCLETQFFPDSPNRPNFPPCLLSAGEVWEHTTVFKFSSEN